jgi:hypothetical protein
MKSVEEFDKWFDNFKKEVIFLGHTWDKTFTTEHKREFAHNALIGFKAGYEAAINNALKKILEFRENFLEQYKSSEPADSRERYASYVCVVDDIYSELSEMIRGKNADGS